VESAQGAASRSTYGVHTMSCEPDCLLGSPRGQKDPMNSDEEEPPEPRSMFGVPVRLFLALGSVALPLLAVAAFSSLHVWPPPPSCFFGVFGCPSAPYPVAAQSVDWVYLAGPLLGVSSAVGALRLRRDTAEAGVLIYRYGLPVAGLLVSAVCAVKLFLWITRAGSS